MVNIEVDGRRLQARKGSMLIEATDAAGIYVPRFCYHKHLSIAASCRMCLVEVEKAPKPMPACATPVTEGMKVFTRSEKSIAAQKSSMEFLLINHPLDCPVCDQGGECELQDLSLGFGSDVSRYTERKRVVLDEDIGPLVQTEMTRCIHCTRCVRFGEEIAGMRELGATGRGENMRIGTYVKHAMRSELSGNIIDLCPVGALTSKPYRFTARAWELRQADGIAPHDCVGSNVHVHTRRGVVKRVVPKRNDAVNEVWLSDRDRFSYEGLQAADRLRRPRLKRDGVWRDASWDEALDEAAAKLRAVRAQQGATRVGALTAASATVEECFALQGLLRGMGSNNVDYRLRQTDFSDQQAMPLAPDLGQSLEQFERCDVVFVIGGNPRHDQPLLNLRLRRIAQRGGKVFYLNDRQLELNYAATQMVCRPSALPAALAAVVAELGVAAAAPLAAKTVHAGAIASALRTSGNRAAVLLGVAAQQHRRFAALRALANGLCVASGATLGYLTEGPNAAGAALAGALPHRGPAGAPVAAPGLDAQAMLDRPLAAYLLLGFEPDLDCHDGATALAALRGAELVIALSAYATPALEEVSDVLLPIAQYAENEGTYVNAAREWQSFAAAVKAPGEARPAWKILRLLATKLGVTTLAASRVEEVLAAVRNVIAETAVAPATVSSLPAAGDACGADGFDRVAPVPMYAADPLVRRAPALQRTGQVGDAVVALNPAELARLGLVDGAAVRVAANGAELRIAVRVDAALPDGAALLHAARPELVALGPLSGTVRIARGEG
ncbi:MAG: NADH-quinone oxidoreductase subunit G [Gammaproteobacteria bacterium]|nr:NADH-quinone oxidoreductase subunit G [Gammaproteobacteria bacterium]